LTRLLLDQGLPRDAAAILRSAGWDAQHVGELGLGAATDERIIEQAIAESRVIITLDADFHALVAVAGNREPSVVRVRREGLRGAELAALVIRILEATSLALSEGALVSVTEKSIRLHKLPIGSKTGLE
jgi:predicted nuclease of predicted toxin-antitoxin system